MPLATARFGHWCSFTNRRGRKMLAFARRGPVGDDGRTEYEVRIRDAGLSASKPLSTFSVSGMKELRAALRRRGAEV